MSDTRLFNGLRVGVASPKDIASWSHGEVKKPETINYRTYKPERDGLFCERTYGPVKDYECSCGRYKKIKYKGIICERCGVEVTRSKVRRERMGHIELAAPVCHIWYLKGVPSPISLILDISPRQLEKVVYFISFIIIDIDTERIREMYPEIQRAVEEEKVALQESIQQLEIECVQRLTTEMINNPDEYFDEGYVRERIKANFDRVKAEYRDADETLHDLDIACEILSKLERFQLIEEDKWRAINRMLNQVSFRMKKDLKDVIRANIGAGAIKELLQAIDLEKLSKDLRHEIVVTTSQKRARIIKRLELVEALMFSKTQPDWMVLDIIPVVSPELRPMVQLEGGRFATSDLNDLYRRIINRNNRLKKIIEIQAPESIINHEKRLLQESIDALIDNGRRQKPVVGSNSRPLKSLSDMLKGKEGRFRKNLLGKRVDYSGRSVIVGGPTLKLHQCGLPKEMALELFKPFVMKTLVEKKITQNIKTAKRMIDRMSPAVWDGLEEVIKEHPVLLNRAPTLHRLGIQAFEPILVEGKAIQVHPLVCHAYNADFDGDQMAVHVPLSMEAQAEARILMLSTQNLFSPGSGSPTISPVQDIVLGCYALTMVEEKSKALLKEREVAHKKDYKNQKGPYIYSSPEEVLFILDSPTTDKPFQLNDSVKVRLQRPLFRPHKEVDYRDSHTGQEYCYKVINNELETDEDSEIKRELELLPQEFETIITSITPGQLIFHSILPYPLKYSDEFLNIELNKKKIAEVIVKCHKICGAECTIHLLDDLKVLGFKWATYYGISLSIPDMEPPKRREEILLEADTKSKRINQQYNRGLMSFKEMEPSLIKLWTETYDQISKELAGSLTQLNPLSIMTFSGARGSIKQVAQLSGMRGLMLNQFNEVIYEMPVKNSFLRGLKVLEYFATTYGARKGMADTALRTADAGYLTRRLVDVAQDVIIYKQDCETSDGIHINRLLEGKEPLEYIGERIYGRTALTTIVDPTTKKNIIEIGKIIEQEDADRIDELEIKYYKDIAALATEEEKLKLSVKYQKMGFDRNEHGLLSVKVRSALTCELEQGICSKCYGMDLSNRKLAEVGMAVGIIAAQSIGEPGTQLTMNTFHTGGVAGSSNTIAGTNQYKTGKYIKMFMEDFGTATGTDLKDFDPTRLLESQENVIRSVMGMSQFKEGEFKKPLKQTKAAIKASERIDSESKKLWDRSRKSFFYTWTGKSSGIVRVEEIFEARRQPRGKAIISPVSGFVADIQDSPYGRWIIVEAEVTVEAPLKDAYVSSKQNWEANGVTTRPDGNVIPNYEPMLERLVGHKLNTSALSILRKYNIEKVTILYPILVPPTGKLPIQRDSKVVKGDPLTEGPRDPHEVLELAGTSAVCDYFVQNLQSVYKSQGIDISDKHIEVIIRQMLRKRLIKESGDTLFLPGQIVDRFKFKNENERVQKLIANDTKICYVDPISGEDVERQAKEASANWILLGITEASLATESFLSAASFQKTTRVLTDAAVRGKKDELMGLKENVIIGRLIPSGTGIRRYRDVQLEVQHQPPMWSHQSLTTLVGQDEEEDRISLLNFPSLSEIARMEEENERNQHHY